MQGKQCGPVENIKTSAVGVEGSEIHPSLITQLPIFLVFYPEYYQKSIGKSFEQHSTVKPSAVFDMSYRFKMNS